MTQDEGMALIWWMDDGEERGRREMDVIWWRVVVFKCYIMWEQFISFTSFLSSRCFIFLFFFVSFFTFLLSLHLFSCLFPAFPTPYLLAFISYFGILLFYVSSFLPLPFLSTFHSSRHSLCSSPISSSSYFPNAFLISASIAVLPCLHVFQLASHLYFPTFV